MDERDGIWVRLVRDGKLAFISAEDLANIAALERGEDPGQIIVSDWPVPDDEEAPSGRRFEDLL